MKAPADIFQLLEDEHANIKRMLKVMRDRCKRIIDEKMIDRSEFSAMIDFIRNYADSHHHGKEEDILFTAMMQEKSLSADKMIIAMNTEHDLGRAYVKRLDDAICAAENGNSDAMVDIIANAVSYAELLERHISKEDNVLYRYARLRLPQKTIDRIRNEMLEFESDAALKGITEKYMDILDKLEN